MHKHPFTAPVILLLGIYLHGCYNKALSFLLYSDCVSGLPVMACTRLDLRQHGRIVWPTSVLDLVLQPHAGPPVPKIFYTIFARLDFWRSPERHIVFSPSILGVQVQCVHSKDEVTLQVDT